MRLVWATVQRQKRRAVGRRYGQDRGQPGAHTARCSGARLLDAARRRDRPMGPALERTLVYELLAARLVPQADGPQPPRRRLATQARAARERIEIYLPDAERQGRNSLSRRRTKKARKRSVDRRSHAPSQAPQKMPRNTLDKLDDRKPLESVPLSSTPTDRVTRDTTGDAPHSHATERPKPLTLYGQTPGSLATSLGVVLTVIAASLLLSWQPLAVLSVCLFVCAIAIFLIAVRKGYGRRSMAFSLPFILAAPGFAIGAAWQWHEEKPVRTSVLQACEHVPNPVFGLISTLSSGIRSGSQPASARYSGQVWTSVLDALSQLENLSLQTDDPQLIAAARSWQLNWSSLTNSLVQVTGPADKDRYLSYGYLAQLTAMRRCEELGFPQGQTNTNGKNVCQSLLGFATMLAGSTPNSDWPSGAGKVIATADGNGLEYAALKYDAANFALLTMDGYIDTDGQLSSKAAVAFASLRSRCARLGVTLPALPSIGS